MEDLLADLLAAQRQLGLDGDPTRHEGGMPPPGGSRLDLTGRRVAHFRLAEPLGGGGMGVLYCAEDTRLGRSVALKFLAPDLWRDPVAKARFLSEAQAASALEHPNICTVFDIGETAEGLLFLAMPRYQGESLDLRLARGPLTLAQAVDIVTQTARGLARAHGQGIVHRDIKPANLFLTEDGGVKILDFGIAKRRGEAGLTLDGVLLGTPPYMAPEQARGERVDARADVWSLGVVFYELLTGRRPFAGGGAAVVQAVLQETPAPVAQLRPEVPAEIAAIVGRMLAKLPADRYQDAREVLESLLEVQEAAAAAEAATLAGGPPPLAALARPRRRRWTVAAVFAVVGVSSWAGLLAWRARNGAAALPPPHFNRLTDAPGRETFPSLSPHGTYVAYARSVHGNADIFLQRVEGGEPIDLTAGSPADDTEPAFSPDGRRIAFRSSREGGGVFIMGAKGESVRRLTAFGFNPSWSPDGTEIAVADDDALDPAVGRTNLKSQIFRVDVATGKRSPLAVEDGVQPAWSPHGWRVAYWGFAQPGYRRAIWTLPSGGGPALKVVDDVFYNWSPAWSADGAYLYYASDRGGSMNLWRVAIDERTGEVLGKPEPVTTPSEWSALPSLSRDGRLLVYASKDSRSFVELTPFDPQRGVVTGTAQLILQGPRAVGSCDVSPDGKWVVVWATSPREDLLLIQRDGGEVRQLTDDPARDRLPRWSPDGQRIVFSSNRTGKYEAWTIRPDGSGLTQLTHLPDQPVLSPLWAPDSRHIAFSYGSLGTAILDTAGGPASLRRLPVMPGGLVFAPTAWFRDGNTLAGVIYQQSAAAESEIPGVVLWSLADQTYKRLEGLVGHAFWGAGGSARILSFDGPSGQLVWWGGPARSLPETYGAGYVAAKAGASGQWICTVRNANEGDLWSLLLVKSGPPQAH